MSDTITCRERALRGAVLDLHSFNRATTPRCTAILIVWGVAQTRPHRLGSCR